MMEAAIILNEFEIRCITNDFENYCFDLKSDSQITEPNTIKLINFVCECILKSNYGTLLKKSITDYGFSPVTIDFKDSKATLSNLLTDTTDDDLTCLIKEFILLFIGVSALQEFVRCNFCGPRDDVTEHYLLISELLPDFVATDSDISRALSLDGESISSNVIHPKLLYVSHFLLSNVQNASSFTGKWWLLRCKFLHQKLLHEKNESLHSAVVSLVKDVYQMDWISKEENVSKKLIFAIESCHVFLFYGEIVIARQYITDAQIITGLEIELSGAIGKRTQYQQKPVAQLYVKLKRNHLNFTGTMPERNECFPVDLNLKDDTLLNKVAFIDNNDHIFECLYAEEQIVLLGYCCLMKRSGSFDELLQEELMSYINCLLCQPQIWAIYLTALIMRCNTEKNSSRRLERAVMQMETVVKSIKMDLPLYSHREKFFYSTSFPTCWMLEKELADLLLSIGCTKSALDIYERLELWEDIVVCYIRLGRTSSAEKVINDQLAKGESPVLWCLLGDVTEKPEHYLKAWELSNHRSARAQRSLGYHHYKRKEYEKCIPAFITSLSINHLQPQVWFSVGHAATQAEKFDLASQAYRQVVMFDEDNFEAWNNLANAYIKTKQKVRAWRSFNEALKCNYEEWRVWENFLLVSTDVGAFEDALRAWHRLFDIKGKHDDSFLLNMLISAILRDVPDINDIPASRLRKKAMELLGRVTSVITNDPKVWELYAALSNSEDVIKKDSIEKVVQYQQKAVRCYNQKGQWERDFSSCKEVLLCSLKLGEVSLVFIKLLEKGVVLNQQKTSAKLSLQNITTRAKKFIDDFSDSEKDELRDLLENLDDTVNEILSL